MATQQSSLRALLDGVPPNASVCHKAGEVTQAIVTTMEGGSFWARLYVGDSSVAGNRIRDDVSGLVALLAEAGIPVEAGWELWKAQAR